MALFPSITAYKDGPTQKVDAATLNQPINQLRERTDYLKERVDTLLGAGLFETVRLTNVALNPNDTVSLNDIVCVDPSTKKYSKARASMLVTPVYPYSLIAPEGFAVGMVVGVTGYTGTVVLYGKVDLSSVLLSNILESGETFRDGAYYLSEVEPGKLTANPKGVAIYIGQFYASQTNSGYGDFAIISPQLKDLYEAHIHKNFVLAAQPAGTPEISGPTLDDTWRIRGFKPNIYNTNRWLASTAYSVNNTVVPTITAENGHVYMVVTSGVSGATEPVWPTNGSTVTDGTVIWQDIGLNALLNVTGFTDADGDTYTIWISSPSGLMKDARVFWSTAGGTDDGWIGAPGDPDYGSTIGLPILFYEKEISIGSKGVKVSFEFGGAIADWDSNSDFSVVVASLAALPYSTWTVEIPKQVKGWCAHKVSGFATYTGTSGSPKEYAIQIFGTYVSQTQSDGDVIKLKVTTAGDFSGAGPTIEVYDINDVLICSFSNMTFSGPAYHIVKNIGGVDYYDLYMVINNINASGVPVADTTAGLSDSWQFAFSDEAVNAKFEYNIGFDVELNAYYPPQPLLDVVLEVNGVALDPRDKFVQGLGSYKATHRTIFWYPNKYAQAPFPVDWVAPDVIGSPENQKNMLLHSAYMRTAAAGIVTSIEVGSGSSVRIVDKKTGLPASTGDLRLDATFNVVVQDTNASGFQVFKNIDSQGRVVRGPVVEALIPGAGIRLTSNSNTSKHQGTVKIEADIAGLTYGDFSDIFYLNAKSEVIPNRLFSYIKLLPWVTSMPNNIPSGFVAKFRVPYSLTGLYKVVVYATLFGLEEITSSDGDNGRKYAGLSFTYSVGPDYSLTSGVGIVQKNFSRTNPPYADGILERTIDLVNDVTVGCTGATSYGGTKGYKPYDPFLLHNDVSMPVIDGQILEPFMPAFPLDDDVAQQYVTAGNIVAVKFARAGTHIGHQGAPVEYTAALGFISLKWRLVPVI